MGSVIQVWEMVRGGVVVADVVQFADEQTVTKWRGKYSSLTVWPEFAAAAAIHTHFGDDEDTTFRIRARIEQVELPDADGYQRLP